MVAEAGLVLERAKLGLRRLMVLLIGLYAQLEVVTTSRGASAGRRKEHECICDTTIVRL